MKLFEIVQEINELSGEEIYNRYYKNIPLGIFLKIIRADPNTKLSHNEKPIKIGKYSKLLLKIYLNKNLKLEDLPKVTEYLTAAYKHNVPLESSKINSLDDIFDSVKKYIAKGSHDPEIISQSLNPNEFNLLYKGNKWSIYEPKTERAACYLGSGTQWCTTWGKESLNIAHKDRTSYFSAYNKQGKLYIIINRFEPEEKYQFHFETEQFMDKYDRNIDVETFLFNNPEIKYFFFPSFIKNVDDKTKEKQINIISLLTPNDASQLMLKIYDKEKLENNIISDLLNKLNKGEKTIYFDFEENEKKPYKLEEVNDIIYNLKNSDDFYDLELYSISPKDEMIKAFKEYYNNNKDDIRRKLSALNYDQFYTKFFEQYIINDNIHDAFYKETGMKTDEDYNERIENEVQKIEKYITISTYIELNIKIPIGYFIPFIVKMKTESIDKTNIVNHYIEYYNLDYPPEVFKEIISAKYENKDIFYDEVNDYFAKYFDENDNEVNNCIENEEKFHKIMHDVFKDKKTIENDIVIIQLNANVIDCQNGTANITILNKKTNQKFEGEVKIDSLAAYALNYKLFEYYINFKRLL